MQKEGRIKTTEQRQAKWISNIFHGFPNKKRSIKKTHRKRRSNPN